jgi:hypothetical protein
LKPKISSALKAGLTAAAPEIAVPAQVALKLIRAAKGAKRGPRPSPPARTQPRARAGPPATNSEGVPIVTEPPLFLVLEKGRTRVRSKGDVIWIEHTPAKGLGAKGTAAAGFVLLVGAAAYAVAKGKVPLPSISDLIKKGLPAAPRVAHSTASWPSSINPTTWRFG